MTLEAHPLAKAFPLLEPAEFEKFVANIREVGITDPIMLLDGMILDGRNRYRACETLGIECPTLQYDKRIEPAEYVLAENLHRRHLTPKQQAHSVLAMTEIVDRIRSERAEHRDASGGGASVSGDTDAPIGRTAEVLAKKAGVSPATINRAEAEAKAEAEETGEPVETIHARKAAEHKPRKRMKTIDDRKHPSPSPRRNRRQVAQREPNPAGIGEDLRLLSSALAGTRNSIEARMGSDSARLRLANGVARGFLPIAWEHGIKDDIRAIIETLQQFQADVESAYAVPA